MEQLRVAAQAEVEVAAQHLERARECPGVEEADLAEGPEVARGEHLYPGGPGRGLRRGERVEHVVVDQEVACEGPAGEGQDAGRVRARRGEQTEGRPVMVDDLLRRDVRHLLVE